MKTMNKKQNSMTKEMNCLKQLQHLKVIMEYEGDAFSLNKYSTDSGFRLALVRSGIIKNTGDKRGKGARWIWNSIEPNIKMAKALLDLKREINREKNRKKYVKKVVAEKDVVPRKNDDSTKSIVDYKNIKCNYKPTKKISILWGLIKIEK